MCHHLKELSLYFSNLLLNPLEVHLRVLQLVSAVQHLLTLLLSEKTDDRHLQLLPDFKCFCPVFKYNK